MIRRLWNHTVRVYRDPAPMSARDGFGHVERNPLPVGPAPTGLNAHADQSWGGDLTDHGPGEQQGARRRWFVDIGLGVMERDVLAVIAGPEAGLKLRVVSVMEGHGRRGRHHTEVMVKVEDVRLS